MTLLDTSAAIDLLDTNSAWNGWAVEVVAAALRRGVVVIDHIVLAELLSGPEPERVSERLADFGFAVDPLTDAIARRAGEARRLYLERRGSQSAILADFLIGAHAAVRGLCLITRDRARFAGYFPELDLITPESHP